MKLTIEDILPAILSNAETTEDTIKQAEQLREENKIGWNMRDAKLKEIRKILYQLQQRENVIFKHYRSHAHYDYKLCSLTASYRKIPNEITSYILLLCIPEENCTYIGTWYSTYKILTHVCSRWKNIAINDSNIWKCLEISIHPQITPFICKLITGWTQYMKVNNLCLKLSIAHWHFNSYEIEDIFKTLHNNKKIQRLLINFSYYPAVDYGKALENCTLPELEELALIENDSEDSSETETLTLHTPKLQELSLRTGSFSSIIIKQYANLTFLHLQIVNNDLLDIHNVLQQCTKLTVLELLINQLFHEEPTEYFMPNIKIYLNTLECLAITTHEYVPEMLAKFETPNLKVFGFKHWKHITPLKDINRLIPFLQTTPIIEHIGLIANELSEEQKTSFEKLLRHHGFKATLEWYLREDDDNASVILTESVEL